MGGISLGNLLFIKQNVTFKATSCLLGKKALIKGTTNYVNVFEDRKELKQNYKGI